MSNNTEPVKFGTDGWRGVIADTYTFENVKRATIPIDDELLLLCSFERNADDSVIKDIFEIVKQLQTITNNYDTKS